MTTMPPIPNATPRQLRFINVLCRERDQDYADACREALLDESSQVLDAADASDVIVWLKSQERVSAVTSPNTPPEFRTRISSPAQIT